MESIHFVIIVVILIFWIIVLIRMNTANAIEFVLRAIGHMVSGLVKLSFNVLFAILESPFARRHSAGIANFAKIGALLLGIYLVFSLLSGFIPALSGSEYSRFFVGPLSLAMIAVGMIYLMLVPLVTANVNGQRIHDKTSLTRMLMSFITAGIFLGIAAIYGYQGRIDNMETRNCESSIDSADSGVVAQTIEKAAGIFDRFRDTDDACKGD